MMRRLPRGSAVLQSLRDLWRYRELCWVLVTRELKLRYRRSVLGILWTLLNPLMTMVILTVVFSHAMRIPIERFPVFVLSALLPWNFFAQSLGSGCLSILQNERLIRNIRVPSAIFPIALVSSQLVNLLLAMIPLLLVMLWQRVSPGASILVLPWFALTLWAFTAGVTLALAAGSVFFRDLTHIIQVVLTGLFYLTPIIYPLTIIPESYRGWFELNPLVYLTVPFRTIFLDGALPGAEVFAISGVVAALTFLAGLAVFRRGEHLFLHYLS
jgi:ABC-type polysaccharide/polyol phosphate export permease